MGAYAAYEEILSRLAQTGVQPQHHPVGSYLLVYKDAVMDIPALTGLNLHEGHMDAEPQFHVDISEEVAPAPQGLPPSVHVVVNSEKGLPELLILHDSFYNACLLRFIEPSFSRVVSMPYRLAHMQDYLTLIEVYQPQVVIVEILERFVDYFLEHADP